MTKIIAILLMLLMSFLFLSFTASADSEALIIDEMDTLDDAHLAELNNYALKISNAYHVEIAFLLPMHVPGMSGEDYIDRYYPVDERIYPDGLVMIHNIDDESWDIVCFGVFELIVTEDVRNQFRDAYNSEDTYQGGIQAFLEEAEHFLAEEVGVHPDTKMPLLATREEFHFVEDSANLLTLEQRVILDKRAEELSKLHRCDIYIVTVPNMKDYSYNDIEMFADYVYEENALGFDKGRDCIMLVLSTKERDFDLHVWGDYAHDVFTSYGINDMKEKYILPNLGENNYNEAFTLLLERTELYFEMAEEDTPFDLSTDPQKVKISTVIKILVVIIVPPVISFIVCSIFRKKMRTIKVTVGVFNYIPEEGFTLTEHEDTFLYRTTTRSSASQSTSAEVGEDTETEDSV